MEYRVLTAIAVLCSFSPAANARTDFGHAGPEATSVVSVSSLDEIPLRVSSDRMPGAAELRAGPWSVRCLRAGVLLAVMRMSDRARVMELSGAEIPTCIDVESGAGDLARTLRQIASLGRGYAVLFATNGDADHLLDDARVREGLARLGGRPAAPGPYALIGGTGLPPGYGFEPGRGGGVLHAVMVQGGIFERDSGPEAPARTALDLRGADARR